MSRKKLCRKLEAGFKEIISLQNGFVLGLEMIEVTRGVATVKELKNGLERRINKLWESISNVPPEWQDFYKTEFNIDLSKVRIKIPEKKEGFDRLLIVAQGITPRQAYEACERRFSCDNQVGDLNKEIKANNREPDKTYAVLVKDNPRSDENLKNKSANQLMEEDILGITITERIILELKYYLETNQHLDTDTITLCSGSRLRDGGIPSVNSSTGGDVFVIFWWGPDSVYDNLRSREVIY